MKQTIIFRNQTYRIDFGLVFLLIIMGITSCFSLYNAFNLIKDGSGLSNLIKQIMWYGIGFGTLIFLCSFKNQFLFKYIHYAYWFLIGCLFYLFISRILVNITGNNSFHLPFAVPINGAISWFRFPIIGGFQPSEFIKIILIIMISKIIKEHQDQFPNPNWHDDLQLLIQIGKVLILPLFFIFVQPDTGLCIIILFNTLVLLMCSGIRKKYIWILFISIFVIVGGFFYLYFNHEDILSSFVSSYRLQRIEAWLEPERHIRGSSNQLYTALLSLGSAGITGYGMQANIIAIPEAHTDFIFAAIGQCFGLIGTSFILLLCLILDLYLCKIAYNTKDRMDRFIVIGVIAMLMYQQIQNLGMIVGLLPITGVTLPLISYGGSSILSYFICFAFIMNISPLSKKVIHIRPLRKKKRTSI